MPFNDETSEQCMEVMFKDAWYGDILRKPEKNPHLVPIEWRDRLPKTAKIISILGEDEFEEDTTDDAEEIAKHAHKMKPVPLSELGKIKPKSSADKKPKRHYRRKTNKD